MALYDTRASRYWLTGYAEEEYALDGPIAAFSKTSTAFVVPIVFADAKLTSLFSSTGSPNKIIPSAADLSAQFAAEVVGIALRNAFSSIGLQFDINASAQALVIKLAEANLSSIHALTVIPTKVLIADADLDGVFSESVLALRQPRSDYRTIQVIEEDRTIFVDQETRTLIVLEEDRTLHIYGVYS